MRHLRQLCCVFAIACLLAPVALADDGVMHPEIVPPPAITGIMHPEDPIDETQAAAAAVLEIALNLLGL